MDQPPPCFQKGHFVIALFTWTILCSLNSFLSICGCFSYTSWCHLLWPASLLKGWAVGWQTTTGNLGTLRLTWLPQYAKGEISLFPCLFCIYGNKQFSIFIGMSTSMLG